MAPKSTLRYSGCVKNDAILNEFYTSFKNRDHAAMARCYHPQIAFSDPVFVGLKGKEVAAMWHMLAAKSKGTKITFSEIKTDETSGSCRWEAVYPYGPKGRMVHNSVRSQFKFQDGKIIQQTDSFDLWKWAGMALGPVGTVLGWSGPFQSKIRKLARSALNDFISAHPEYLDSTTV